MGAGVAALSEEKAGDREEGRGHGSGAGPPWQGEAEAARQWRSPAEESSAGERGHGDRDPSPGRGDGVREETRESGGSSRGSG